MIASCVVVLRGVRKVKLDVGCFGGVEENPGMGARDVHGEGAFVREEVGWFVVQ